MVQIASPTQVPSKSRAEQLPAAATKKGRKKKKTCNTATAGLNCMGVDTGGKMSMLENMQVGQLKSML